MNAPMFAGSNDPLVAEQWLDEMERMYRAMNVPTEQWVIIGVSFLIRKTEAWWKTT